MKKIFTLLAVNFFIMAAAYSQECQYSEYFYWIDLARNDFAAKKYKKANDKFKTAFSKTEFPLGTDLSTALFVAKKRKDASWAEIICIQLAKGGIPLKYFNEFKDYKWFGNFKSQFGEYTEFYNENFNCELRERLIVLGKEDYQFNKKFHQWRTREIEMTLEELITGAEKITREFENIFKQYGFPSEKKMGYYFAKNRVEDYLTMVVLIHIYQRGELLYSNQIDDLVCNGYLTPDYKKLLEITRGIGNSNGVAQEMKARYEKFK